MLLTRKNILRLLYPPVDVPQQQPEASGDSPADSAKGANEQLSKVVSHAERQEIGIQQRVWICFSCS